MTVAVEDETVKPAAVGLSDGCADAAVALPRKRDATATAAGLQLQSPSEEGGRKPSHKRPKSEGVRQQDDSIQYNLD